VDFDNFGKCLNHMLRYNVVKPLKKFWLMDKKNSIIEITAFGGTAGRGFDGNSPFFTGD
jgi:hypothetical protein